MIQSSSTMNTNSMEQVQILIKKARHIQDRYGTPLPVYVEVSLTPTSVCPDTAKRITCIQIDTAFPSWEEQFTFAPLVHSTEAYIVLRLFQSEEYQPDTCLGTVQIPLHKIHHSRPMEAWFPLNGFERSGSILIKAQCSTVQRVSIAHALDTLETRTMQHPSTIPPLYKSTRTDITPKKKNKNKNGYYVLTSQLSTDYLDQDGVLRRENPQPIGAATCHLSGMLKWLFPETPLLPAYSHEEEETTPGYHYEEKEPEREEKLDPYCTAFRGTHSESRAPSLVSWLLPEEQQKRRTLGSTFFDPRLLTPMSPLTSDVHLYGNNPEDTVLPPMA